jgi:hypothetical protein
MCDWIWMTTGADKLTEQAVRHNGVRWVAGYFTNRIPNIGNTSLCTISTITRFNGVPSHCVMDHPRAEDGRYYLKVWRVATNTLSKELQKASDKSSWRFRCFSTHQWQRIACTNSVLQGSDHGISHICLRCSTILQDIKRSRLSLSVRTNRVCASRPLNLRTGTGPFPKSVPFPEY